MTTPTGDAVTTPHPARRPAPTTIPPAYIVRAWNGGAEVACPYCHELHRHRRLPPPQRDRGYRTPPCQTHTGHSYRITRSETP